MAAPLRQGECHLPPRRKEVSGPWVNAARPTEVLLELCSLDVKTEDPGPQDPLLLHSRAPSQATPTGASNTPTREQAKRLWLQAKVPRSRSACPGSASPLAFPPVQPVSTSAESDLSQPCFIVTYIA